MVVGFTTTYIQSVPISTEVVSSNPAHGEVHSIQHYIIKSVTCDRSVVFSTTNKTDCHYINEILLKEALNTTTLTPKTICTQIFVERT